MDLLKNLEWFSLASADITGDGMKPLGALPKLSQVTLEACHRFQSANLSYLSRLQLSYLCLFATPVHSADLVSIKNRTITRLELGLTRLDDSHADWFSNMPNLESVDLSSTRVGDRVAAASLEVRAIKFGSRRHKAHVAGLPRSVT